MNITDWPMLLAVYGGYTTAEHPAPIMLKVVFWILLILWAIGVFGFYENLRVARAANLVLIILLAILGFYVLGF